MPKSTTPSEYRTELLPPEGDPEVGKTVWSYLEQIVSDKIQIGLHDRWLYYYRLGRNQHWREASSKLSLTSPNLLFTHRQRTINMMTANNPTFNVKRVGPIGPEDEEKVNVLLHLSEEWWIENEVQHIMEQAVHNGETYGCTIGHVPYDPEADAGNGDVTPFVIDNFQFGWWPLDLPYERAEAIFYFRPMSVREAWRKWPAMKEKITPDNEWMQDLGRERRETQGGQAQKASGWKSTISGVTYLIDQIARKMGKGADSDELLVVSCYVKDYTSAAQMREKPRKDQNGNIATIEKDRMEPNGEVENKYPDKIRYVVTCNGGKVVLEDRTNPCINWDLPVEKVSKTYLFGRFPFTVTPSITDPSNPWGSTDFEQGSPMQIELNKTISQYGVWKDFTLTRQKIINPQNSGVDDSELSNYPGIIRPMNAEVGKGIRFLEQPPAPAEILKGVELYKDFFMLVMGTWDFDRAQSQGGGDRLAYKTLQALIEIASMMAQGKIRNYSKMDREWGRMFVSHVQNWYINREDVYTTIKTADGKETAVEIYGPDLILPVKLSVVSGSTMPISRVQQREEAIALFEKGAIPNKELLKKLDYSGWEEIIKEMQEGPLSDLIQKMSQVGVPPIIIQFMQMIQKMDPKQFEKALKDGKMPTFQQIMSGEPIQKEEEVQPTGDPPELVAAKVAKEKAGAAKEIAEAELIKEKITSEKVLQQVKLTGIEFDREKLNLESAKTVNEIRTKKMEMLTATTKEKEGGEYREKGASSNNEMLAGE